MENVENNVIAMPVVGAAGLFELAKTLTLKLDEADWEELECQASEAEVTLEQLIESILYESL